MVLIFFGEPDRAGWGVYSLPVHPATLLPRKFQREFTAGDGTAVVFRRLKRTDTRPVTALINALVSEGADIAMDRPLTVGQQRRRMRAMRGAMRRGEMLALVVCEGKRVVGHAQLRRDWGRLGHRAELAMALLDEYRGKGIGRALMECLLELAADHFPGIEVVYLRVFSTNTGAIRLYGRLGFVTVASIPKGAKVAGGYADVLIMQKDMD